MPGVHLGEAGRAQAQRLAARLKGEGLERVHCSPRERTRETAGAIAEASALPDPIMAAALDEIDFGRWSGHDFETLNRDPDFCRWNAERATARTPAGESMGQVQARVVDHLDQVARHASAAPFALVTHADVIKAAVCHVLALPLDAWWRFDIAPASITRLETGPQGYRLVGLNDVVW
uniref:histidine phosphatase family protein n=1 Tax=Aquabacter sp. L1I39 TaxID=2820278 RepID=UPI001FFC975E|nr:histidine phosphatase family protein [Aquabacter sp. L1I39]